MQEILVHSMRAPVQAGPYTPAFRAGDFVVLCGREGNA